MGIILFVLSNLLAVVLIPVGILWGLFKAFFKRRFISGLKEMNGKFYKMATAIDKYGNIVCAELFNTLLITSASRHLFGNPSETISAVIGYNLISGTLSREGKFLNGILNLIDKNHCLKAIGQA